ncbi:M14 family zinc carboxypeptidase [Roseivirga pacifica]|uniref:M14 family metallopeptidase n=1 Tax=Roseivirga pacifica TaxID=1267423 RepID=UPI003BAB05F7
MKSHSTETYWRSIFASLLFLSSFFTLKAQEIPTPERMLGFPVGADFKLATYDQSLAYFQKLAEVSDQIKLFKAGKTSYGRDWYYSVISTKENLDNLDRYKEIAQQLAHPKGLTDEQAKALAREGKPFVHIDGGLHASEVAGAQHTISLAYELLSSDEPKIKEILENTIIMLWPSLNPDGQNIVADWYHSNVGTPYEVAPLPVLYQKYIGHDNNRDAYMLNMIESRVIARTWREWEPQIIHVHHQSSPFPTRIWLPPFAEPIAGQTPPIMAREVNMIGMAIAQALESNGMPGAVHMGTGFDAWYPGYVDYMPMMQNIAAYWTETALYRYATPHLYTINDFPKNRSDLRVESLYSSPWKGGWWRLKDAVDYMQVASVAVLEYAAKYGETVQYNRYQAGRNTIEKYENEPPYAYFIPQEQRDPVRPVELLKRLAFSGIEVSQLTEDVTYNNISYPAGTWVIPMDQEYAELARQLLDVQEYPDLREYPQGPPEQPYDAAGWTLPFMFEVNVVPAMSPLPEDVKAAIETLQGNAVAWDTEADASTIDFAPMSGFDTNENAAGIVPKASKISGSGSIALLDPKENNSFRIINKVLKANGSVSFSNGKYAVQNVSSGKINEWAKALNVNIQWTNRVNGTEVKSRIALYRPHTASMDEGWTRWLLEQFEFEFTNIGNSDIQMGNLNSRFDVILFASERASTFTQGFREGSVPPQYAGGLGELGIQALNDFVSNGGTLVAMNSSTTFMIDALNLPVKNVTDGVDRKDYFAGSSILGVETNPTHPVMAGMATKSNIFVSRSPAFITLEGFEGEALAKYQTTGSPLRSGYLLGEEFINGTAAALSVKHGNGNVVLLGFSPQWRGQTMGTYRVLFNSLLYTANVANTTSNNVDFWTAPEPKN